MSYTDLTPEQIVINRINARNILHKYANKLTPIVINHIKSNGYNVRDNNTLYKRDNDKLRELINNSDSPLNSQVYIEYSEYSGLGLRFKISYATTCVRDTGGHSCAYYETHAYCNADNEYIEKETLDIDTALTMFKELKELKTEFETMRSKISGLNYILIGR